MTDQAIKEIRDHVQRIDDSLRGNGSAGLFTEFHVLRERVTAIERFIIEVQGLRRWVFFGILGLFGTLGWNIIEWYLSQT
jgi:hypothetical protein|tara:strand:- start:7491 stop:7730 length:240 start_codon:yes stop_codon:yes gene_type:complete